MKNIIAAMAVVLAGCGAGAQTQAPPETPAPPQAPAAPQTQTPAPVVAPAPEQAPPVTEVRAPDNGLNDLAAMTFECPKAALNAAAREAAKVPSQGTYQFAYFGIVSDSHHASYEVHFKSNYHGEQLLKYCVAIYCQQGWDPKTTQASVMLMGEPGSKTQLAVCGGDKHMHAGARHMESSVEHH
ncbi:MAG TPA: hypothetical protein VJV78_34185 [Polyangiales bacterium]|nr:hypothetical protein [Polyangiales bacterium]